ncbi:MAG: hypothetical protein Q9171_002493 [Xanthocarpia ochracea]
MIQWSFVLLVCYDPRTIFSRLRQHQTPDAAKNEDNQNIEGELAYRQEPYPTALSQRISWVLTLLISLRLANWKTGEASHDRKQPIKPLTRTAFCRHAVYLAFQSFIILDITSILVKEDPYFHIPSASIHSTWPPPSTELPQCLVSVLSVLPPQLMRTAIPAIQAYALITQGGSLPTIHIVMLSGLGLWPDEWSPHTWPIFFGPFSAVSQTGLRGLWGTWWHQTNRYLSTPGRALAKALSIETRSTVGYMLQIVSAFSLSGIMHMGLIPPEPRGTAMTAMEMRLYVGSFFWMQALGIGVELGVVRIFRRILPGWSVSPLRKAGTLMWVMLWFSCTVPLLVVPFRELGYWKYPPLPISVIGWLLGRECWTW